MNQLTIDRLKSLLRKLKSEEGSFIISSGNYYCKFTKIEDSIIRFEAVSHQLSHEVSPNTILEFQTLGFNFLQGDNYSKEITLRTDTDFEFTAEEVRNIFSNIYKLHDSTVYVFSEEIAYVDKEKDVNDSNSKFEFRTGLIILTLLLVGAGVYFIGFPSQKNIKKPLHINDDGSVEQVMQYLKGHLKDAESYQPVKWVQFFNSYDSNLNPIYQIGHRFRSKNSYGGFSIEDKLFSIDNSGKVVDVSDIDLDEMEKIMPKDVVPIR